MGMMMPDLNFQQSSSGGGSGAQPGAPGGGGLPTTLSTTLSASLALVPPGLAAVAVFPPFVRCEYLLYSSGICHLKVKPYR